MTNISTKIAVSLLIISTLTLTVGAIYHTGNKTGNQSNESNDTVTKSTVVRPFGTGTETISHNEVPVDTKAINTNVTQERPRQTNSSGFIIGILLVTITVLYFLLKK